MSLCLNVFVSELLCLNVFVSVSLCLNVFVSVSLCLNVFVSVSLFLNVFVSVSLCLNVFVSVSLCLNVFVSVSLCLNDQLPRCSPLSASVTPPFSPVSSVSQKALLKLYMTYLLILFNKNQLREYPRHCTTVSSWPEMTDIINILLYPQFTYHFKHSLFCNSKLYYAMFKITKM